MSTSGWDGLVLVRLFPSCRTPLDIATLAAGVEAEDLCGETELFNISVETVLKLMGMSWGGLIAAKSGLLLGVWLSRRGFVISAKGAS